MVSKKRKDTENQNLVKKKIPNRKKLLKQKKFLLQKKLTLLKKIKLKKKKFQIEKNFLKKKKLLKKFQISVGSICEFKINALGLKNIGIDDRSKRYPVLIPNAKLGDRVKAKIFQINFNQKNKYAIAKLIEVIEKSKSIDNLINVNPGDILEINIKKVNEKGAGIVELENNYKLIIPNAQLDKTPVNVQITRIKSKYAFGHIINSSNINSSIIPLHSQIKLKFFKKKIKENFQLVQGSKLTIKIPKKVKKYGKYLVLKLKGLLIFLKLNGKVKIGNKIRIKFTKVNSNFALGKILKINPNSLTKKQKIVKYSISQMLKNGVHLGENESKCHAKMKKYIWLENYQKNKKDQPTTINLLKTHRCLNKALNRLTKYAFKGRNFLFIGTKQAAASLIEHASVFTKTSFFVNTRWLGGMLTNWATICESIFKIDKILREKQEIVYTLLKKRRKIKRILIPLLRFRQKTILKKFLAKKNQLLIKQLKSPKFSNFLSEQLENRKQILKLINKLKEDKESLNKLIVEKQLENRLLNYKLMNSNKDDKLNNTEQENDKLINLAMNRRNQIKIILNFLLVKKIDSEANISNKLFIQLIKKKINFIRKDYKKYSKLNKDIIGQKESKLTKEKKTTNPLIKAKRNIKKIFKFLSQKKKFSRVGFNLKNLKKIFLLKKFLKLLPLLKRVAKISQRKLKKIAHICMKKFIDLPLRRSFKKVFSYVYKDFLLGDSKKISSSQTKKWKRLEKYLGGISNMTKISEKAIYKNVAIIIGQKEEMNAVRECKKLGLETFHIVDTNCNPTLADHIIPANDDSKNSIKYILHKFLVRIRLAQKVRKNIDSKKNQALLRQKARLQIKKNQALLRQKARLQIKKNQSNKKSAPLKDSNNKKSVPLKDSNNKLILIRPIKKNQ
uniref:Small ribosomal subunit protein uS2c n=1 Tax=Microglena monadina TaxID=47904 RepID=A0A0S2IBN7_9CHLO|nr:ribosomal protein S2 [Microglena monadina]